MKCHLVKKSVVMGVRACNAHVGGKTLAMPFVVTWAVTVTSLFLIFFLFFSIAETTTCVPECAFACIYIYKYVIYIAIYIRIMYNRYSIYPQWHLASQKKEK